MDIKIKHLLFAALNLTFKPLNKTLSLNEYQKSVGCVTASSGNHGAASAHAMRELGINGLVFLPEKTSTIKVEAIKRAGCEVRFFGRDGVDTENYARQYALDNNLTFLSPYNDEEIIAGQSAREPDQELA